MSDWPPDQQTMFNLSIKLCEKSHWLCHLKAPQSASGSTHLFQLEDVLHEKLLQIFVCKVYTQLFEAENE